jgi:predicted RNA-binding Zn ribbon-like protein
MDDATKRYALGESVEPGGRSPAPGRLRIVQQFLNTWNHELPESWDRLGTRRSATDWVRKHGLVGSGRSLTEADRRKLIRLRDDLRGLLMAKQGRVHRSRTVRSLNSLGAPLAVLFDGVGTPYLRPVNSGVQGVIAQLLSLALLASEDGTWGRLKACRQCEWMFYDGSKNLSAQWCSMSICGNRSKNRDLRRRRRLGATRATA